MRHIVEIVRRTKNEIIIPHLQNSNLQSLLPAFTLFYDDIIHCPNDFSQDEDLNLLKFLNEFDFHLIIMKRPIVSLIKRYTELKKI